MNLNRLSHEVYPIEDSHGREYITQSGYVSAECRYQCSYVKEEQWHGWSDEELLQVAYQEYRFVLTHDANFGALAIHQENACYGILYLRLHNVRPATIIQILAGLIQKDVDVTPFTIGVIEEKRVRIRHIGM